MFRTIVAATVRRRLRGSDVCIPGAALGGVVEGEIQTLTRTGHAKVAAATRALTAARAMSSSFSSTPMSGTNPEDQANAQMIGASGPATKGDKELSDWATVKEMLSYVKPSNNRDTALRLSAAFGLLLASKGLNVQVPFMFKHVVDALNEDPSGLTPATIGTVVALTPPMLVVGYGVSRIGASLCNEMRNAVFAKVTQNAIRTVANRVFRHLHQLDLSFHLDRQTGAVSRVIDRGTRGINFIMSSMVFNVIPTALEVSMVSGYVLMIFCAGWFDGWTSDSGALDILLGYWLINVEPRLLCLRRGLLVAIRRLRFGSRGGGHSSGKL